MVMCARLTANVGQCSEVPLCQVCPDAFCLLRRPARKRLEIDTESKHWERKSLGRTVLMETLFTHADVKK